MEFFFSFFALACLIPDQLPTKLHLPLPLNFFSSSFSFSSSSSATPPLCFLSPRLPPLPPLPPASFLASFLPSFHHYLPSLCLQRLAVLASRWLKYWSRMRGGYFPQDEAAKPNRAGNQANTQTSKQTNTHITCPVSWRVPLPASCGPRQFPECEAMIPGCVFAEGGGGVLNNR